MVVLYKNQTNKDPFKVLITLDLCLLFPETNYASCLLTVQWVCWVIKLAVKLELCNVQSKHKKIWCFGYMFVLAFSGAWSNAIP